MSHDNEIMTALQEIREQVIASQRTTEAIREEMEAIRAQLIAFQRATEDRFDRIDYQLSTICRHVPGANIGFLKRCVLSNPAEEAHARHFGDRATWSLLHYNNYYFAVGCAHCAFYHCAKEYAIVNVPAFLRPYVIGVGVLPGYTYNGITALPLSGLPSHLDFAALLISVAGVQALAAADNVYPVDWCRTCTFDEAACGRAVSGDVLGDRPYVVDGVNGQYYGFVQRQGEPGNSGALMFSAQKVLGVYLGIELGNNNIVYRGRICPLPDSPNDLKWYPVIVGPPDGTGVVLLTANGAELTPTWNGGMLSGGGLTDGFPVVFVDDAWDPLMKYAGHLDCGICWSH